MDKKLVRVVIGSIVFGLARASYLKMNDGQEFKNPEIIPSPEGNSAKFGVVTNPEQSGETLTFNLNISEVDILY